MPRDIELRAMTIREFNRFYTNIIGLVNQTILKSPYSLAEARVLLEIDTAGQCTASDLVRLLQIDPGYLSRMLTRFIKEELVIKSKSLTDGRVQLLSLTDKGKLAFAKLSETSTDQLLKMLKRLPVNEQEQLVTHMSGIQSILSNLSKEIVIRTQRPGDAGYIAYRHGILYEKEYQLDKIFEQYVLESLITYLKSKQNGNIWIAESDNRIVGFIGVSGIDKEIAQLRWFLIEPEFRGIGLGRQLMTLAMDFCRQKEFKQAFLWTFQELDAARHLYKNFGFNPTETVQNDIWKDGLIEEKWEITL